MLRIVFEVVGVVAIIGAGNLAWMRHCRRTGKSFMDWLDGPWVHWKELNLRVLLAGGSVSHR
jgi:hypothetical protein